MSEPSHRHRVVVAGGGITGLVAARRLALAGHDVTLVEQSDRLGGQVHTVADGARHLDLGAEAIHLGPPVARDLVTELGLLDSAVGAGPGQTWLWNGRRLRSLPAGVTPSGPTRLRPVVTSGVMSVRGLGRAALEPLLARLRPALAADGDVSVGDFVAGRFGREVAERFVDPLLGSLHGGDVHELSLRACAPALVEAATRRRSLVRRRPAPPGAHAPSAPLLVTWPGGLRTLTDALLADVPVDVRLGTRVTRLAPRGAGYVVATRDVAGRTAPLDADAVVLALPAAASAPVVAPHSVRAAHLLGAGEVARVATVVVAYDRAGTDGLPAFAGTGVLLPSTTGTLLRAATHLSQKWPHLADSREHLVRLSAGRSGDARVVTLDDDELVAALVAEHRAITGARTTPRVLHVRRWDDGLPQQQVGHHARLRSVRAELATALPGVVLAGSAYDGLGLASCIASGTAAAAAAVPRTVPTTQEVRP